MPIQIGTIEQTIGSANVRSLTSPDNRPSLPAVRDMAQEHVDITFVCLPGNIKKIARDRYNTNRTVDDQIGDHPQQHGRRGAEPPSLKDDVGRNRKTGRIADTRHKADQTVDAEAQARAGDSKLAVEKHRQPFQPLQGAIIENQGGVLGGPRAHLRRMTQIAWMTPGI